ncbi:hypothetical protein At1D1609_50130 [Agrobacterium tumefaciens]|uniref:Uncharacterized protein n=1 Tax=Agrobacterium tumefaciens TaxID=358 RepID=A0A2L2LL36_AGRTU|nr:hypothetical protein At1D1609_50130 [Agrobacterium tumefaciens]
MFLYFPMSWPKAQTVRPIVKYGGGVEYRLEALGMLARIVGCLLFQGSAQLMSVKNQWFL